MEASQITVDDVKAVLVRTLGIEDRADEIGPETKLIGELPDLDSLAIMELITELDEQFELDLSSADLTAEIFETLDSLTEFVSDRARAK